MGLRKFPPKEILMHGLYASSVLLYTTGGFDVDTGRKG
jgi:hypothetical protein